MNAKTDFIPYGRQTIEEDDIQAVVNVLRSPFLTTGPKVSEFEEAFRTYVHAPEAIAISSGTAGLHAAMAVAGIGPGDEVLVPALSFVATANAVLYVGARPVFVDSLPGEFNMDPSDAARKVTSRTKAIVPVHFAGQSVNLEAIHALAKTHRLLVIEDAAHALGTTYKGKRIGSLSDMTVFSFHPVKHITSAEGGMVTTPHKELAKKLRRFRHHGIDVDVIERDQRQAWQYDVVQLGYNYRLNDLQCALGLSQLGKSDRFSVRRHEIATAYDRAFQSLSFFEIPPRLDPPDRHAWHLYILRLPAGDHGERRDQLFTHLRKEGIGVHVHYRPIYQHPFYQRMGGPNPACSELEKTFPRMLSLPIYPLMTDGDVERVITTLQATAKLTS